MKVSPTITVNHRHRTNRFRSVSFLLFVLACLICGAVYRIVRAPVEHAGTSLLIEDVTQLSPTLVESVMTPKTTEEIIAAVRNHRGPISIGGARHSMGGQIAAPGTLHIDMREFNRILAFSPQAKTIRVQAGVRWRQILERVATANLSVAIMQSYANFTVGGSISTNVHGRSVGRGPLIGSLKSIHVVLADSSDIEATPDQHSEIFNGVVGGYGGLGVITEATLALTDDVKVKRDDRTLPIDEYAKFFFDQVRDLPGAVFHNGDIYPDAYNTVHAITYTQTDAPVTVSDRLIPEERSHRLDRLVYWIATEWPFGKSFRQRALDPLLFAGQSVTWRNYQESYDVSELEPASRNTSTYALADTASDRSAQRFRSADAGSLAPPRRQRRQRFDTARAGRS